jgi:hypothetical protein
VSVDNPFSMHTQSVWETRSANRSLPNWVRISALAFGCHRANGHANFAAGELEVLLGVPGENGWKSVSPQQVSNAIAAAKQAGWIAPESRPRCLVVPHHAITGGLGHPHEKCSVHVGRRQTAKRT